MVALHSKMKNNANLAFQDFLLSFVVKVENRQSFDNLAEASVTLSPHVNGHEDGGHLGVGASGGVGMHTSKSTGESGLDSMASMEGQGKSGHPCYIIIELLSNVFQCLISGLVGCSSSSTSTSSMRRTTSCPDSKAILSARPDPVKEICDIQIKIADLGNACWVVSALIVNLT